MNTIHFNKDNIELLNLFIYDASIESEDINNLIISSQGTIEFQLERRCLENVKRKKFLCFTKTSVAGMSSKIVISNVDKLLMIDIPALDTANNHFLLDVKYDDALKLINFSTVTCQNLIQLKVYENFSIVISDISFSKYGKCVFFKKVGYTMDETIRIIKNKNYSLSGLNIKSLSH